MTHLSVIGGGFSAFVALCAYCVSAHLGPLTERLASPESAVAAVGAAPAAVTAASGNRLVASLSEGRLMLEGRLAPRLRERLVARGRELFGPEGVVDRTETADDPLPPWTDSAFALVGLMRGAASASRIEIDDATVQIGGDVASTDAQARLVDEARAMAGALTVQDRMHVAVKVVPQDRLQGAQREVDALLSGETIEFQRRSSEITDSAAVVLSRIARILAEEPKIRIRIEGHTDARGDPSYNFRLSRKRARAVRDYLIAHGIAADRVVAEGYGSTRPLVEGTDPTSARVNRRIEFKLDGGG